MTRQLDLVGITEIAAMARANRNTVSNWVVRYPDFPAPVARLAMGSVWRRADIARWLCEPGTFTRTRPAKGGPA